MKPENYRGARAVSIKHAIKERLGKPADNEENGNQSFVQIMKLKKNERKLPPIPSKSVKLTNFKSFITEPKKFLDLKRWHCLSRPQSSKLCGITTIVGCWNYLYSVLGNGTLPILTPETAMKIVNYNQDHVKPSGVFINNKVIITYFETLCEYFKLQGKAKMYWRRDNGELPDTILREYITDIKNKKKAFVYHCYNHYLTPLGYDIVPNDPAKGCLDVVDCEGADFWIILGETTRQQPSMQSVKWREVVNDITCNDVYFYNIREKYKGMQIKRERGKNNHCFILFEAL